MSTPIIIDAFRGAHRFLSNFYPCQVWGPDLHLYPTNEHAYQAAKASNEHERAWIAAVATPGDAKQRGRKMCLQQGWQEYRRYTVMENLIAAKFDPATQPDMAALLANTGDAILIEGNTWHDNLWGVCSCDTMPCARTPGGANLLGWMLMRQRARVVAYT